MTKHELAAFVLKLLGIYAIIRSLPLLYYLAVVLGTLGYENNETPGQLWMYAAMSIPSALTAIAGIILLACSQSLARVIVKKDGAATLSTSLGGEEIQSIGFSIVAVFVLLSAMPQLVQFITNLWYIVSRAEPERARPQFIRSAWQSGLSVVVQCGLASVLFFRARGLANLWRRIQIARYVKI